MKQTKTEIIPAKEIIPSDILAGNLVVGVHHGISCEPGRDSECGPVVKIYYERT
jgi:hypothetical protein